MRAMSCAWMRTLTGAAGAAARCKNREWPFYGVSGSEVAHCRSYNSLINPKSRFWPPKTQKIFRPRRGGASRPARPGAASCRTPVSCAAVATLAQRTCTQNVAHGDHDDAVAASVARLLPATRPQPRVESTHKQPAALKMSAHTGVDHVLHVILWLFEFVRLLGDGGTDRGRLCDDLLVNDRILARREGGGGRHRRGSCVLTAPWSSAPQHHPWGPYSKKA